MDRRSTFRLRFPWSSASEPEPATKPATQPNTKSTGSSRTTRQGTRSQPSSSTRSKNSPSSSPANENSTPKQPPSSTTTAISGKPSSPPKVPSQPTTTSTSALPETLTNPPQLSAENKAPIESSTTNTKPTNGPASPKNETQTPTSTISERPQSSLPGVAPSGAESQSLIPSQEHQGLTSQPASPSDVANKSNAPQPPSRPAPQSQEMSPKSSPTRNGPQVLSTDQLAPKPANPVRQTSSNPSDITSQMQLNDQTISQPTSPPKQSQDSSEISPKSTETLPSNSEKEPMPATIKPQSEQMELPKKEAISDTLTEAKDKSPENVKPSDSSRITSEPKTARPLETNIPETKEVKEVVQQTTDPDIVFQSKQAYTEKQANSDNDQIRVNRVSNGKQTRTISAEPDIPLNKEVKDNISKFINRMTVGDGKQKLEEGPVSVITLAGDNRGASMQLSSNSSRKGKAVHIHRGYKLNADETADATTDAEGTSKGKQTNDARTTKDQELEAYMNCNVQGLNNSITFDSTIEGKNPGIHMTFPRMPSEPPKTSEKTGLFEAHKAEYNVARAQKHTYKPTIKRRCLEGLFVEPSDSDSDNPEKPRKHGCHVGGKKKRDNDIDILETNACN
ncbi:flocculation protein FLO11-like [Solanum stenotomum]|uniref:flocculation protein FLO11-like n=1 Tax=Solanum stenotomum TaxID=172797 RepID=UPI0020D05D62|nr:flocculation protein FLO11-like [Solanum stenotomum]